MTAFKFARYVRGRQMAERITINRAATFEHACQLASDMADPRDVLIYCQPPAENSEASSEDSTLRVLQHVASHFDEHSQIVDWCPGVVREVRATIARLQSGTDAHHPDCDCGPCKGPEDRLPPCAAGGDHSFKSLGKGQGSRCWRCRLLVDDEGNVVPA